MQKSITLCGLLFAVSFLAHAGQEKSAFEVASIKPNVSTEPGDRRFGPSRVNIHRASLLDLVTIAYEIPYSRVTATDPRTRELLATRYDVAATAGHEVTKEQLLVMLQTLDWSSSSIFTDIEKQLGLKLEADKAPVDTLVIDHRRNRTRIKRTPETRIPS